MQEFRNRLSAPVTSAMLVTTIDSKERCRGRRKKENLPFWYFSSYNHLFVHTLFIPVCFKPKLAKVLWCCNNICRIRPNLIQPSRNSLKVLQLRLFVPVRFPHTPPSLLVSSCPPYP